MSKITPKEKAESIWNDFDMIIYTDQDHNRQVRECSIKLVDEILLALDWIDYSQTEFTDVFWQQVKQELEKM